MTVGTMLGGRIADRPLRTMCFALFTLAVSLAMFLFTAQNTVLVALNVFLTGIAGMAAIPSVQARILDHGGDAPELGSASVQSAFNIANSLGASSAASSSPLGFGLTAPSTLGAMLSLAGAGFGLLGRLARPRLPLLGRGSLATVEGRQVRGVMARTRWAGAPRTPRPAGSVPGPPTGARKTGCPGERASDTLPPCTRITSFSDPGPRTRLDPLT